MRFGIFGGTFDPPHLGHKAMLLSAIEHLELDEVVVVPAGKNPLKRFKSMASRKQRFEMAGLAFGDIPKVTTSDIEIERQGLSYTIDTLTELKAARGGDYWIIVGADAVKSIQHWKQADRLVKMCRLAVVARLPDTVESVRELLPPQYASAIDVIPCDPLDTSSTDIRKRVAHGESLERWVEPAIEAYIARHNLYRS